MALVALVTEGALVPVGVATGARGPRRAEVVKPVALTAVQPGMSPKQWEMRAVVRKRHAVPTAGGVAV